MYYGAYNTYADLDRGNQGFSNTWAVVRFASKADRQEFLTAYDNKKAQAVTRERAEDIWDRNYRSVGETAPVGGLFSLQEGFRGVEWEELKAWGELSVAA